MKLKLNFQKSALPKHFRGWGGNRLTTDVNA
nr:MAG TPA: hypothetical protein [Caudoviricetes sp.]